MDSGTVALVAASAVVIAAAIGAAGTITAALITSRNKEPKRGGQEKGSNKLLMNRLGGWTHRDSHCLGESLSIRAGCLEEYHCSLRW